MNPLYYIIFCNKQKCFLKTVFESLDAMLRALPPFTSAMTFASLYEFAMAYDRTTTLDYQLRDVDIDTGLLFIVVFVQFNVSYLLKKS